MSGQTSDDLMRARLQFRQLLEENGLVGLSGSVAETLMWLETQIIELADSVTKRQRFIGLLRQTREMLSRGQEESKVLPNGERTERRNPYVEVRFRKIRV
jgi:hypothetical protein